MNIALDLSTTRCGIVKFTDSGEIIERFAIVPDQKVHPFLKIKYIVAELERHFVGINHCCVEGIFLNTFASGQHGVVGFETLARLSGAVINAWLQTSEELPTLLKATEARRLAGIKGTCQKAEVQVFVAEHFKLATQTQIDDFKAMIEAETGAYLKEEFTKATWKKHMQEISTYIEGEIELSEDEADALVLSLAFVAKQKEVK